MVRHPITAILITCSMCGLIRMAHDDGSAQARGKAHSQLSGHTEIKYTLIESPDSIRNAEMAAKASMESMAVAVGMKDISTEAGVRQVVVDVSTRR